MRNLNLACLALLLLATSARAGEPEVQVGDFIFRQPAAWRRQDMKDGTGFVLPSSGPDKRTLLLLHSRDLNEDVRTAFDREWAGFRRGYSVKQSGDVTVKRLPNGSELAATQAVLADSARVNWIVQFMMAKAGRRLEGMVFISNDFDSQVYQEGLRQFGAFLANVRFSSAPAGGGAPPAAGPLAPPAGGPAAGLMPASDGSGHPASGVYRSVLLEYSSVMGNLPASNVYRYATFFPDHAFSNGLPLGGLDGYDRAAEIRYNPVGWGTFTMNGARGRIVFSAQPGETPLVWTLVDGGTSVEIKGRNYQRLDPCDGLRLQGTYRRSDNSEYARQNITFYPDGRFVDEGVFKAAAVTYLDARSREVPDDGRGGSGTYVIGRYTLRLQFSDGRVKRSFFTLSPGASRANLRSIEINTNHFTRVR